MQIEFSVQRNVPKKIVDSEKREWKESVQTEFDKFRENLYLMVPENFFRNRRRGKNPAVSHRSEIGRVLGRNKLLRWYRSD